MDLFGGPKQWTIDEQVIEDPASGLTFQFEVLPNGYHALRVFGDLPFGNREIIFDQEGREAGSGTSLRGPTVPIWNLEIEK